MSINIVKKLYESYAQGHREAILNTLSPDVKWISDGPGNIIPFAGEYDGPAAVARFFDLLEQKIEVHSFTVEEYFVALNGMYIVSHGSRFASVVSTGRQWSTKWYHLWKVSGKEVTFHHELQDTAAVAAAFDS